MQLAGRCEVKELWEVEPCRASPIRPTRIIEISALRQSGRGT